MTQILIYDNNTGILEKMRPLLTGEDYGVAACKSFKSLYESVLAGKIQLLITDVELADEDGIEAIRQIRGISSIPILVLSENGDGARKIAALNAGADDYVVYPCNPLELLARVKSHLRRYTQLSQSREQLYRAGGLVINDESRKVTVDGKEVRLTPIEYKILRLLVQERGRVLSIDQIYESIWKMKAIGADNTVAVHIRHIREKIEQNPKDPQYLKVVWGTGYKVG